MGKLRSNFLGTRFMIFDSQPPHIGAVPSTNRAGRRVGSKQVSPRVPGGSYIVAHISYELNVLGTRGPRRMQCFVESVPASCLEVEGAVSSTECPLNNLDGAIPSFESKSDPSDTGSVSQVLSTSSLKGPLLLKNKTPRWHEQLQCWCLNFRGRVTVPSVKNFQLVSATEIPQLSLPNDYDKVLLQFGKVGKDVFTMDYRYPLSAFQAFAICLSSFDTKLACE
eukprot:TRINITY_DN2062_c0_g2_i3.p1 TRINITY_DN2062_c0_g2~~TRINITY_DN2062_c0_g2_i3.p1  ORF type:complete len:223 (+),score=37.24 TRINITY_DN2062_c0_g2_i3:252-920(+)